MVPTIDDEQYADHLHASLRLGREPQYPQSKLQFLLLAEVRPHLARHWRPAPEHLERLGLPLRYPNPAEPWDEETQEAFLQTLASDREFAVAVNQLLRGAGR